MKNIILKSDDFFAMCGHLPGWFAYYQDYTFFFVSEHNEKIIAKIAVGGSAKKIKKLRVAPDVIHTINDLQPFAGIFISTSGELYQYGPDIWT
jgi:hypothetical protein